MPHNVLEYSSDLAPLPDLEIVFARIHEALDGIAGARIPNSKSRARPIDAYIADGDPRHAMVHLDVRLMEGRSDQVKAALSSACLDILEAAFEQAGTERDLQITVAIADLERRSYAKHPPGTLPT